MREELKKHTKCQDCVFSEECEATGAEIEDCSVNNIIKLEPILLVLDFDEFNLGIGFSKDEYYLLCINLGFISLSLTFRRIGSNEKLFGFLHF